MNKKDILYVVIVFVMMCVAVAKAEQKEMYIWGERIVLDKPVVQVNETGRLKVLLYVFNDKTGMWDRAREETLKNMQCDSLHINGMAYDGEYLIDKGLNSE